MPRELIAFLNFEFRKNTVSVKSVSGETMTEVPRIAINWKEYQAHLASLGVKSGAEERPLFRRYLSYLSSEDLYDDLISFQAELRSALLDIIDTGSIPEAFWRRIFKDTNGLPMFIEPEGEGDWNLDNARDISFCYDFSADTYRLFVLALLRGLILSRRIFYLAADGGGKFSLKEEGPERGAGEAAAYSDAERRAALRAAVARDLPAALSRAVAENLPKALAESAAEKLPLVMDALIKDQLPKALSEAVEKELPKALSEAAGKETPKALSEPPAESFVSIVSRPFSSSCTLSVPGLRLIEPTSSISVPAVSAKAPFNEEPEESLSDPLEPPDLSPVEYAESFQEEPLEEDSLFELRGPAAEQEDIEPEDIEPMEAAQPGDREEPLVLSELAEAGAEAGGDDVDDEEEEEIITPLPLEDGDDDDDGWLPFLKLPSKNKAAGLPLEQRLATLEQRGKRRAGSDAQDKFDF